MGDAGGGGDLPAETGGGWRSGPCRQPHAEGESRGGCSNAASGSPFGAPRPAASEAARRRDQKSAGSGPEGAREARGWGVWGGWAPLPRSIAPARDPPGTSPAQPLEQEAVESRVSSMGGGAAKVEGEDLLGSQLQVLRNSSHPLASDAIRALGELAQIAAQLVMETQRLSSSPGGPERPPPDEGSHHQLVSELLARNEQLERELRELKRTREDPRAKATVPQRLAAPSQRYFPVQVRTTGKTGGCEKQFLEDVSNGLAGDGVFLRVEGYQKDSNHCLLVFCPVTSRIGTDTGNALEGLSGVRNTILVALHLKPKDSNRVHGETRWQAEHQTVVATVHAFFTMQDGFYPCSENREAVASVVAAIRNYPRGS